MKYPVCANLVLSGGGIRGIAYVGVFSSAEKYGISFRNIAGVSAGSIAGALAAAGFRSSEIYKFMSESNFGDFKITEVSKRIPAVMRLYEYSRYTRTSPQDVIERFLQVPSFISSADNLLTDFENRGLFSNLIQYSKEGCLFDGNILEEWVYNCLSKRGVHTFGDIRNGVPDKINPKGYKIRMSAVDADRKKIIILPDDLAYYGYDPDKFSVATAVRMSCSVPFAFKPVTIESKNTNNKYTYHIVDGGVLDGFPTWLVESTQNTPAVGFRLKGEQKKLFSLDTPLAIYKSLLSAVHDIGVPKEKLKLKYEGEVDCSSVGFLDMDLDDEQKRLLVYNGKISGNKIFPLLRKKYVRYPVFCPFYFGRRMGIKKGNNVNY